jgi:UV DNA damage repair endonuclease
MFTQNLKRIGFACKYLDPDQTQKKKVLEEIQRTRTEKCTTVAWLDRQTRDEAEQRLWDIMVHNTQSAYNLVEYVGGLANGRKMVRLGSNQLPMYTQADWRYFWTKPDVREYCEKGFAQVGKLARQLDVRLSFHPGQFCVLASDNPDIVERSIDEFEYHADMARWMGFGKQFQDFKCNVHISGRQGPDGVRQAYKKLSPEARNIITIENEENSHGLDTCLELADLLPIVLDIHHHWCREGEYIDPGDERVKRVVDSWRGVRPTMHYSYSRNEHLPTEFNHTGLPDMQQLLEAGHKKQKLRAHSDFYPNQTVNAWALSFHDRFDIMCESKMKNLASKELYEQGVLAQ